MSIKKILCPTDFSGTANNATEYAAKLASKTNAQITLTHVMSLPEVYDNFSTPGLLIDFNTKRNEVEEKLKNYATQVSTEFHVACGYEIGLVNMEGAGNEIRAESETYDLIVCGTNGADTIYQFYFGSNSYRISKNAATPALIVPEVCSYKEINHIVFASGYIKGDHILITQLNEFMKDFNPALTVLHVSEKETPVSQEIFHSFTHLLDEAFNYSQKINFHRIVNEDEASSIEDFIYTSKADALALCLEEHGFLYRIFHTNLIKKITSYADYPVLIFHK